MALWQRNRCQKSWRNRRAPRQPGSAFSTPPPRPSYLEEQPPEGNALVRLFGTGHAYQKNLKGVLERRIGQLSGIDSTLKRYLERGTEDLPDHPDLFLSNVRGIVDQAFELI